MHPSLAPMQSNVMTRYCKFVTTLYAVAAAVGAAERFVVAVVEAVKWTNYVDVLNLRLDSCHSSR